jgi:hypothetical protein
MYEIKNKEESFLDLDFINISGLKRVPYSLFWHPNGEFLKTLEFSGIQAYLLEETIYGCFVNKKANQEIETQWFGHHMCSIKDHEGKIVPDSTIELYQIMELCNPEKIDGIIFNLDILSH